MFIGDILLVFGLPRAWSLTNFWGIHCRVSFPPYLHLLWRFLEIERDLSTFEKEKKALFGLGIRWPLSDSLRLWWRFVPRFLFFFRERFSLYADLRLTIMYFIFYSFTCWPIRSVSLVQSLSESVNAFLIFQGQLYHFHIRLFYDSFRRVPPFKWIYDASKLLNKIVTYFI